MEHDGSETGLICQGQKQVVIHCCGTQLKQIHFHLWL